MRDDSVTDDERSDGPPWHDDPRLAIAGGVAALLLLALLIYGVVQVSEDSSTPRPDVVLPDTSTATSPTHSSGLKTLPSTSYALPSAQTTAPAPTPEPPSEPGGPAVTDPPTTIYNPYTTTTTTNAGHV